MSVIQLDMPGDCHAQINGVLLQHYRLPEDLPLLDQDILEVALPNNMRIDVGWFPENDPDGSFVIRVFRKNTLSPVRTPIEEKLPQEVAKYVVALVKQYGAPPVARAMSVSWSTTRSFDFSLQLAGA